MPIEKALQKALDESIPSSGVKGVSAAVIFPDGKLWNGASGFSHNSVPVTTEMLFDIGSVQENLQAALTLMLVDDGFLSLDDPVEVFAFAPRKEYRKTTPQLT